MIKIANCVRICDRQGCQPSALGILAAVPLAGNKIANFPYVRGWQPCQLPSSGNLANLKYLATLPTTCIGAAGNLDGAEDLK